MSVRGDRVIHALDANVAPGELITMREQVDRTTASQRIAVTILVVFGGLAVGVAAIGLYGVVAPTVSQSTRELALRMRSALAHRIRYGYLLYKVSPRDSVAFGSATVIIAVASPAACLVPAWRATRTDPIRALRG